MEKLMSMTTIWVKTAFVGFHFWKDAPEDVKYLSYPHRHLFKVSVEVKVNHDDRDIEFHTLKSLIDHIIQENPATFGTSLPVSNSCEQMAKYLASVLFTNELQVMHVCISEDGENGASVYFLKDEEKK